ncbi:alpha/beta-hydrolase [Xylariaceae sp. FL1019]|nr:alpha/beta-hydrolase [Xylariaceae sp. FL1019]
MEYTKRTSSLAAASNLAAMPTPMPAVPRQSRHSARRKIDPSLHLKLRDPRHDELDRHIPPASPEVISSLITSLSAISQPASKHFDDPSLSLPASPAEGSFGVEYGGYIHALDRLQEEEPNLNDLAAAPPVIRTSKPPSGLSPLTAPKSPKSPRRESSGGLKSFLRNASRPSSKGSASAASHDDTHSVGNLSIERGQPTTPDLRPRRSQDSWGAKLGKGSKVLKSVASSDRLRPTELDRKSSTNSAAGSLSSSIHSPPFRPDQMRTAASISEEPGEAIGTDMLSDRSPSIDSGAFLRPVPLRDSSLRKTGQNAKRSSRRSSKNRTEETLEETIPEDTDLAKPRRRQPQRSQSEADTKQRRDDILMSDLASAKRSSVKSSSKRHDADTLNEKTAELSLDQLADDGAPSPAIYQNRRHSAQSADRRKSGRTTPDPMDMLRSKRSSSRLKRRSTGTKSPEPLESKTEINVGENLVGYERPGSADSIDDAVESYLCSPRLSQKIRHPQTGRVISFSEVGDSEGSAVFCCVGMGLTRYITAFYDELALALKLRLITPDRPGVGDSETHNGTVTPLGWPDDVYAICQALKITKFSILAHSAGAIYALATALRMPQHIRGRIHLLAPWIPPSQMSVFGTTQALPPTNAIPTSQKILRALPTPFLKAANSSFMTATSSSITSSLPKNSPRRGKRKGNTAQGQGRDRETAASTKTDPVPRADKENMMEGGDLKNYGNEDMTRSNRTNTAASPRDPIISAAADALAEKERQMTYDLRLTHAIWDLATTGANPAVDLLVCLERRHTIGFRYVDITRSVVIHHGSKDTRVPVDNVRWLGKAMRRCEVRVLEDEGHGLMASASVMGSVLMEISKEWEDWTRLTNPGRRGEERGKAGRAR